MRKHSGITLDKKDGVEVIDCRTCGFAHVMPLPGNEELQRFYEKDFYDTEMPEYFNHAEEDRKWWRATYDHYYDLLEAHTKGRRLLDIGSGPGYFLDAGVKRGWEVLGFEPSAAAARYSAERGLTIVNEMFSADKAASHGLFDAAMISLVFEHVPDPAHIIEDIKHVLVKGGLLCIITPNDYNPLQKLLVEQHGFKPWWVAPKHHLNYFTVDSLTRLLESHGLVPVEAETSYPMEFFLLSGCNYVADPKVGRACHKERMALEMALFAGNKALLCDMYHAWAKEGIGREAVVITRKEK